MSCDTWEPISETLQATERLADRAFRASSGEERFVVYMEAYTRWQNHIPWNLLAKSGLLSEREQLPTICLVYIFLPRGYQSRQGEFHLTVGGSSTQRLWFREICLWQLNAEKWWQQAPALMALYPLTRHGRSAADAVCHAANIIITTTPDRILRADLLTTLFIFGKLASPGLNVLDIIGREQMKESKAFDEIMELGRVDKARDDIVGVVEARFGTKAAEELRKAVKEVSDEDELSRLLRLAAKCRRPAELRRALTNGA